MDQTCQATVPAGTPVDIVEETDFIGKRLFSERDGCDRDLVLALNEWVSSHLNPTIGLFESLGLKP